MKKKKMKIPKSVKIYIRKEKARIRRSGATPEEENKIIDEAYQSFGISKNNEN